ncbi:substrate-binding domain-containing protein, partial [Verminephrobacter sp. Larva24]
VPGGSEVLTAIDNLGAQQAQGFIICVPDVKLGSAVVAKAKQNRLKLMTVDDRLVDGAGKPIESVPHMGISAQKIGELVGQTLADEIKKRAWKPEEVGAIRISYDQLPTAKERTDGASASLTRAGFPAANILNAPQSKTDTEAAFNAAAIALTKNPRFKHWIAFGLNDEAVLGAVRAAEGQGIKADQIIGVGIGGSKSALNEFAKPAVTGFFGTVLISPKRHGYETAVNMYDWIKSGKEPEKLILTAGSLMTRANIAAVKKEMGLD